MSDRARKLGESWSGWALATQIAPTERPDEVVWFRMLGATAEEVDAEAERMNSSALIFRYRRVWVTGSVSEGPAS